MSERPRVLVITPENPYPPDSGGRLRTRSIVDVLEQAYELDVVTYERPDHPEQDAARERMGFVAVPMTVTNRSAAIRSLWRRRNSGYKAHSDIDFTPAIRRLCATHRYDLVVVNFTMQGHVIPLVRELQPHAKVVLVTHNVDTELERQLEADQTRLARRAFYRLNTINTRRHEILALRRSDLVLVTSEQEAAALAALAPDAAAKLVVVPNVIDARRYEGVGDVAPEPGAIVFCGLMSYFPNVSGALHYHREIHPKLRAAVPGVRVYLAGADPHPDLLAEVAGDPSIVVTGAVESVADYIARSEVMIVPLTQGSGTRLKVLEGWAVGRPVVSTTKGCEGLACEDGRDILVADDPASFADAVTLLLDDPALAQRLVAGGRESLLARYDVRAVAPGLLAALAELS